MEQSIKKHVRKRTICYWGTKTEQMFLLLLGITVMYTLLGYNKGDDILLKASIYMMMVGSFMILVMPMTFTAASVPLVISMGASRKETFLGIQFSQLLYLCQMGIVTVISSVTLSNEMEGAVRPLSIWCVQMMVIVLLIAISQYGAWLQLRFSTKGAVIYSIVFGLSIIGMSLVIGFTIGTQNYSEGFGGKVIDMVTNHTVFTCVTVAGFTVVLFALGAYLTRREIMRYEVRR